MPQHANGNRLAGRAGDPDYTYAATAGRSGDGRNGVML